MLDLIKNGMTITIKYYDYTINNYNILKLEYPNVDYEFWKRTKEFKNDIDLCKILDDILKNIDCRKEFNGCRMCMTTYPMYNIMVSKYYYYLIKINNQELYNKYLDKLINLHNINVIFEYCNPIKKETKEIKTKSKLPPNKYYRYLTHDLFTNEEIYLYINPRTNHEVRSNNPNLLEELNSKKKKVKQTKVASIPLTAMTFSFKKK